MAVGTAHILFPGGGMVLSAGTPYERQVLIEHVLGHVRSKHRIEVEVDRSRWMVELAEEPAIACGRCGRRILDAVCHGRRSQDAYCVVCALKR